jgi:hypothetical protein
MAAPPVYLHLKTQDCEDQVTWCAHVCNMVITSKIPESYSVFPAPTLDWWIFQPEILIPTSESENCPDYLDLIRMLENYGFTNRIESAEMQAWIVENSSSQVPTTLDISP